MKSAKIFPETSIKHTSNIKFDDNTEKIHYRTFLRELNNSGENVYNRVPVCVTSQKNKRFLLKFLNM